MSGAVKVMHDRADMTSNNDTTTHTTSSHRPQRPPRPRHDTPLLRSLDREWTRLRRAPSTIDRMRRWVALVDDPVSSARLAEAIETAGDLDRLLAMTQRSGQEPRDTAARPDADQLLGAIVEAAAVDELAARTVLQRILPGVISQARRWDEPQRSINSVDVAIGAAWIAIAAFDSRRRPRHVAASLISDVVWIAFRRASRRLDRREIPVPNDVLARRAAPEIELHPIVALAATVRMARRAGVSARHLDLVCELARSESQQRIADDHEVTPRTIRNRRDVASAELRTALGSDWADWRDALLAAA